MKIYKAVKQVLIALINKILHALLDLDIESSLCEFKTKHD